MSFCNSRVSLLPFNRTENRLPAGKTLEDMASLSMQREQAVLKNTGLFSMHAVKDTGLKHTAANTGQTCLNTWHVMCTVIGCY